MADELKQSQVSEGAEGEAAGAEASQPAETEAAEQPGAEDKASQGTTAEINPKTGKTFTQDEVDRLISERTSKVQTEAAEAKRMAAQMVMERQIAAIEARENQAKAKDDQDLANGVISEDQARDRAQDRLNRARQQVTESQMNQRAEVIGRVIAANDIAKEYGIDADKLLKDESLKSPLDMVKKAAKLALDDRDARLRAVTAKPESYDKGPGASDGGDTFSGTVTQDQLDDDAYWNKNKVAILKAQREGKLKVK